MPTQHGIEQTSEPLISGDDTRQDLYEVESERFRELALKNSLALISDSQLEVEKDGIVRFDAPTLGASYGLCPSERFVSQPALANCSATLVDDDLLVTAAHCVDIWPCKDQLWARGFAVIGAERPPELHSSEFYRCRTVPARSYEQREDGLVLDYAFVQLDRPVSDRRPARLSDTCCPEVGAPLTVIGYPSGLPVKIDGFAPVLDERRNERDYFSLASDTFVGSSGSGVFDEQGVLLGTLVRGGNDYVYDEAAQCRVARHVSPDGSVYPGEQATYVERSLRALCDSGWPSEALCGRPSACGDGFCSRDEHGLRCTADCPEIPVFPRSIHTGGGCSLDPGGNLSRGSIPLAALVLAFFVHRSAKSRLPTGFKAKET